GTDAVGTTPPRAGRRPHRRGCAIPPIATMASRQCHRARRSTTARQGLVKRVSPTLFSPALCPGPFPYRAFGAQSGSVDYRPDGRVAASRLLQLAGGPVTAHSWLLRRVPRLG